jgi:hypothetical protein
VMHCVCEPDLVRVIHVYLMGLEGKVLIGESSRGILQKEFAVTEFLDGATRDTQ